MSMFLSVCFISFCAHLFQLAISSWKLRRYTAVDCAGNISFWHAGGCAVFPFCEKSWARQFRWVHIIWICGVRDIGLVTILFGFCFKLLYVFMIAEWMSSEVLPAAFALHQMAYIDWFCSGFPEQLAAYDFKAGVVIGCLAGRLVSLTRQNPNNALFVPILDSADDVYRLHFWIIRMFSTLRAIVSCNKVLLMMLLGFQMRFSLTYFTTLKMFLAKAQSECPVAVLLSIREQQILFKALQHLSKLVPTLGSPFADLLRYLFDDFKELRTAPTGPEEYVA